MGLLIKGTVNEEKSAVLNIHVLNCGVSNYIKNMQNLEKVTTIHK